jgi:hypothetical protein
MNFLGFYVLAIQEALAIASSKKGVSPAIEVAVALFMTPPPTGEEQVVQEEPHNDEFDSI